MANQMPTPEMVPKTPVRIRKNLEWLTSWASHAERSGVGHAHGFALGHGQIEAAAHGKLRDHDMEDGDDADHPARAEISSAECPRMDSSFGLAPSSSFSFVIALLAELATVTSCRFPIHASSSIQPRSSFTS
jgi:hypothetical protein